MVKDLYFFRKRVYVFLSSQYKIYNLARRLCLVPRCCPYNLHNYIDTLKYNICRLVSLNVNSTVPALYTIKEIQKPVCTKTVCFHCNNILKLLKQFITRKK